MNHITKSLMLAAGVVLVILYFSFMLAKVILEVVGTALDGSSL